MTRWLSVLGFAFVLASCAAAPVQSTDPIHDGDTVGARAEALREEQFRALREFDQTLSMNAEQCSGLCNHHTAICGLATRICDIAKGHPGNNRASALCDHANETCRQTSIRLPKDCMCLAERN